MSDIPIGSPPAPPGRHAAPQGWYPDPVDRSRERYWDGWSWSRNTRGDSGAPPYGSDQAQPGAYQQSPYQQGPYQQSPYQQAPYPHGQRGAGRVAAGPLTEDGVPLAGWGWRFLSGALDLIIVSIISSIFAIPIYIRMLPAISSYFNQVLAAAQHGGVAPRLNPTDLVSSGDQMLVTAISVVVGVVYFTLFWRLRAATPAQLLCGLRIVPFGHGRNTGQLSWASVFVRALVWAVPFSVGSVLMIFALFNALSPLWNPNRQAIHDLAARTQIVKIR